MSDSQPLDPLTRVRMEPHFGRDFSHVRVHIGDTAAGSAKAVGALAYTVGHDVVFGEGRYRPETVAGQHLIAHELSHIARNDPGLNRQPAGGNPEPITIDHRALERALKKIPPLRPHVPRAPRGAVPDPAEGRSTKPPCSLSPACQMPIPGSSWDFSHQADEHEKEKRAEQAKLSSPPKPSRATQLEAFAKKAAPGLTTGVTALIVNPAIADEVGAQAGECDLLKPSPGADARCIEVPEKMEKGAAEFNQPGEKAEIQKIPRADWQFNALRVLTHEVSHLQFEKKPPRGLNTRDQVARWELNEMNAQLSEFPLGYKHVMSSDGTPSEKLQRLRKAVEVYINKKGEGYRGMLTKLRCVLPCAEVDRSVRLVFEAQASGWPAEVRNFFLTEVNNPVHRLGWPIPPPPALGRPEPERPKMPPLYVPRGDFNRELIRSGDTLE